MTLKHPNVFEKIEKKNSKSSKILGIFTGVTSLLRAITFFLSFPPMETLAIDSLAQDFHFHKSRGLRKYAGGSNGEITKKLRQKSGFYDKKHIFF